MAKQALTDVAWNPSAQTVATIRNANAICAQYQAQGLDITLRQLYYQFVARGLLANTEQNYKSLSATLSKARWQGLMDWNYLVDRTRGLVSLSHWTSPAQIMRGAANSYRLNHWADATHVVQVWVEKQALAGIIGGAAEAYDVPWFACRGYDSTSEMYAAARGIAGLINQGKEVTVFHLGDHDPSGVDMSRDNEQRLSDMVSYMIDVQVEDYLHFERIALTMVQIQQYNPPPAPAKTSDSRHGKYVATTGTDQAWELDALDPTVLNALVTSAIESVLDQDLYDEVEGEISAGKAQLTAIADRYTDVTDWLDNN